MTHFKVLVTFLCQIGIKAIHKIIEYMFYNQNFMGNLEMKTEIQQDKYTMDPEQSNLSQQ